MFSYTITIGRNQSSTNEPMSTEDWNKFQNHLKEYLETFMLTADRLEIHEGIGEWNGISEESVKFTLLTNIALLDWAIDDIKYELGTLAAVYDQEAIALTIGESILVSSITV